MKSQLLQGKTWHRRHSPTQHAFEYPMTWLSVDLGELSSLDRDVALFGHNRRAPFAIRDADYAGSETGSIREKVLSLLAREGVSDSIDRVDLITLPRVFGYAFNPVSFFRCYDAAGGFAVLVAEVRNTFGEKHHYVLRPIDGAAEAGGTLQFRCKKEFYVSPFNRVDGEYAVRWLENSNCLWLEIELIRDGELVMTAGMSARTTALTTRSLMTASLALLWRVAAVVPRIGWQAALLRLRKRTPAFVKPEPTSAATIPARRPNIFDRLRTRIVKLAAAGNALPNGVAPMLSMSKENSL